MMNYYAVAVSSLIPMIVGFIYYNPKVMGGAWMRANGFKPDTMTAPKPVLYLLCLVMSFLMSSFLWVWVTGAGGQDQGQVVAPDGHSYVTFQHGAAHGVMFSITVLLPIFITMTIFERRGWPWAFVNWAYWALTVIVMCGILSAWR